MIRVRQIKININEDILLNIKKKCVYKLHIRFDDILEVNINKRSIDARNKPTIYYIYEVDLKVRDESIIIESNDIVKVTPEEFKFNIEGTLKLNKLVIVGMGPAGLFAGYILSKYGYKPLIIERGRKVEDRINDVNKFFETGVLDITSNVQFGEGGAGTFSDGKLNTMVKDPLNICKKVFEIFVENGAPSEIMYDSKPHIGTDLLRKVVKNIREKIIAFGGEIRYETCLTDIKVNNNKLESIIINNKEEIPCDVLLLAPGHSARDTFEMLNKKIYMEPKPFAVGVRIMHPQKMIDESQYGMVNEKLGPGSYTLKYTTKDQRGVYTFCMCPGGYVVNSSSEQNMLSINGMSNYKRDTSNANSAIIVTITPDDFGHNPLDGIYFQQELERKAFDIGNGKIPVQLYKDFKLNKISTSFKSVKPIFKGDYTFANINQIFPNYINKSLIEGIDSFRTKIRNYNMDDAIIAAVESRTSSPIRIVRDELGQSSIQGIYPCGEGAGYSGGITSSAMDGIKVSLNIAKKYKNN